MHGAARWRANQSHVSQPFNPIHTHTYRSYTYMRIHIERIILLQATNAIKNGSSIWDWYIYIYIANQYASRLEDGKCSKGIVFIRSVTTLIHYQSLASLPLLSPSFLLDEPPTNIRLYASRLANIRSVCCASASYVDGGERVRKEARRRRK
jgi:hypothetical protein